MMVSFTSQTDVGTLHTDFLQALQAKRSARVLELGTLRSNPERSTHHKEWCAPDVDFVMSDMAPGLDVDVVADIHSLRRIFHENSFDFVIACSVYEHVQRPWIAAKQINDILRPDGQVFIQTHNCFPIHGFPSDYWRFTQEALRTLFEDAGMEVIATCYEFEAVIHSERDPNTRHGPAFLNVCITARKPKNSRSGVAAWVPRMLSPLLRRRASGKAMRAGPAVSGSD